MLPQMRGKREIERVYIAILFFSVSILELYECVLMFESKQRSIGRDESPLRRGCTWVKLYLSEARQDPSFNLR